MSGIVAALPWAAIALVILQFSLADDLPAPEVTRTFVAAGLVLLMVAAVAALTVPALAPSEQLLVAAGPLMSLAGHRVLRAVFRRWKREEPVLAGSGARSGRGTARFFFEKGVDRRVTWLDYLYSFLLGMVMLLACTPAMAQLVERSR